LLEITQLTINGMCNVSNSENKHFDIIHSLFVWTLFNEGAYLA